MPIGIGYRSQDTMDAAILPPREHACRLIAVSVTEGLNFDKTETVQQLKWTFEALKWQSPDGKPGVISLWTGLYYGSPKAKLTGLLDQIFGRSLSEAEASRIDMEKLAGVVQGYVMVVPHKKQDGTMTSKFGAFRQPDNRDPLDPADFFADGASPIQQARNAVVAALPTPPGNIEDDLSDVKDPFDEN